MSITLPSAFTVRNNMRIEDFVVLVEIFYSETDSYKLATKSCVVDGSQWLGIVSDGGVFTENWNIFEDNTVALSVPEIRIIDYTSEADLDGSFRFSELLVSAGVVGNRIKVYYGFIGLPLSGFLTVFDGVVENVSIDSDILISCQTNELPETLCNGRKLSWENQEIGEEDVPLGVTVPEESDGLYLPVPFGNQWNSPLVNFNIVNYSENEYSFFEAHWAEADSEWAGTLSSSTQSQIVNSTQPNTLTQTEKLLVYQEGVQNDFNPNLDATRKIQPLNGYVPVYRYGYRGGQNFDTQWYSTSSGSFNMPGLKVELPTSSTSFNLDATVFANVPIRLYRQSESYHIQYQDSDDGNSAVANMFDGDDNTWWSMTGEAGADMSVWVSVEAPLDRNLRTDENFRVYTNRPIWVPESDDEYTTLMMGRYDISRTSTGSTNTESYVEGYLWSFIDETPPVSGGNQWLTEWVYNGSDSWSNFVGLTYFGREGLIPYQVGHLNPDLGYNYVTYPFIRNISTESHVINFATDKIGNRPWYESFVAPAGNDIGLDPEVHSYTLAQMGSYPHLRRQALNNNLKGIVQLAAYVANGLVTMDVRNLWLESFENIPYDLGSGLYAPLTGVKIGDPENELLSAPNGIGNNYVLQRPIEYLELIYRSKLGATEDDFNYNEWALGDDDWTEVYGQKRTGSGFVFRPTEEYKMRDFVSQYCQDELFTSYRDNRSKFRFVILPKDPLTIIGTPTVISHSDLVSYKTYFSPLSNLFAEIKSLKTDFIYADDTFVNDTAWIVSDLSYEFDYWKRNNTRANNTLIKELIEKKFTSYIKPDMVTYGGYAWTCQKTGTTSIPGVNKDWSKCPEISGAYGSVSAWTGGYEGYIGVDAEPTVIANLFLNQWANLHRMVDIETKDRKYLTLEVGDICEFASMPKACLGLTFKGWNSDSSTTSVTVNGQRCTYKFMVTNISRGEDSVTATLMNLHCLEDLTIKKLK